MKINIETFYGARVDSHVFLNRRIVRPPKPSFARNVETRRLAYVGPWSYDLSELRFISYPGDARARVSFEVFFMLLRSSGLIRWCPTRQDNAAIIEKGPSVFDTVFPDYNHRCIAWRSAVRDHIGYRGRLVFPFLVKRKGEIIEDWCYGNTLLPAGTFTAIFDEEKFPPFIKTEVFDFKKLA